ncbi:hypothetical protein [Streptomyces roseoverticillatus]|uniref:Uncharacterized protein n=1 Tax=Streptomyces roseoverticillatus TaxID=66429 RepID=A0ABV3ISC6_9ACTN
MSRPLTVNIKPGIQGIIAGNFPALEGLWVPPGQVKPAGASG